MVIDLTNILNDFPAILIQMIIAVMTYWTVREKTKPLLIDKQAEAKVDIARAQTTELGNFASSVKLYEETIAKMISRDNDFVALSRQLAESNSRITEIELTHKMQLDALRRELNEARENLDTEKMLRLGFQRQMEADRMRMSTIGAVGTYTQTYTTPANTVNPPIPAQIQPMAVSPTTPTLSVNIPMVSHAPQVQPIISEKGSDS